MKIKYLSVCEDNQDLCKYVETGDILISNERLYTSKVGTCSILMFKLLDLNVMAHIDAGETKKEYLIEKIKNTFSDFELKNIKKIYLIIGPWCDKYCYENNKITQGAFPNIRQSICCKIISKSCHGYKHWNQG